MSVIVKLLSKFDDSGIRKAKHEFGSLKKIAGTIGIGIGLKQIASDLFDAAKAASADQKSMQLLNSQLTRNAHATESQITQNNAFIESLSNQVGIVDDNLRPAQAKLARATGSVAKSQQLLKLALDASSASGKPLETVVTAISKAYNGNTSSLVRLFPELKKSKDALADLNAEVSGTAAQQADPFAKLNVAMDNLKEKLGAVILPYLVDFIDTMVKPGGAIDQMGNFLDDVSNPKTEAGKTFTTIKTAIDQTIQGVKDFFALFGNGDAMAGFGNVASTLVKMLPALLALKGILWLAKTGKSLANLASAIGLIKGSATVTATTGAVQTATTAAGVTAAAETAGLSVAGAATPIAIGGAILLQGSQMAADANQVKYSKLGIDYKALLNSGYSARMLQTASGFATAKKLFPYTGPKLAKGGIVMPRPGGTLATVAEAGYPEAVIPLNNKNLLGSTVNVHVYSADPKVVVDAVSRYIAQNGGKMPTSWGR